MERRYKSLLGDEYWERVFKQPRQDRRDISSVSSVCEPLLSMSNKINTRLKKLSVINVRCDDDLIAITDLFPCLEKLRIDGDFNSDNPTVTDAGIEVLARKLKGLVKITLLSFPKITDKSLEALSSNCLNLKEIGIGICPHLTENGIGFMMRNCRELTCLSFIISEASSLSEEKCPFTIRNSVSYARNLVKIQILGVSVPDKVLCLIANSRPLLRKVWLIQCAEGNNFSFHGLKTLVKSCPLLKHLELNVHWLTDEHMVEISDHLSALTYINLRGNPKLTRKTFYTLTRKCPLLKTINMDSTYICDDLALFFLRNGRLIVNAIK